MGVFFFVLALPFIPETLAPVIVQRNAGRLRVERKYRAIRSQLHEQPVHFRSRIHKYALKPAQMMAKEPIMVILTIYTSLGNGVLYLIFFAFPLSFENDRGWSFGVSSLPFIAVFIGVIFARIYMAWETQYVFQPKLARATGSIPAERLPPMIVSSVVLVIGLFWFA